MQNNLSKVFRDLKDYLEGMEKVSKDLDSEQKEQLATILSSVLTLLVSLRRASHLGEVSIDFLFNRRKRK